MKSLIKEFYNPELKWVPHYWEVFAPNGEDTEFWDGSLDKCKAFCEARGWDYEIVPLNEALDKSGKSCMSGKIEFCA